MSAVKMCLTDYGFRFGAATVERACSDAAKGWVLLTLKTPKTKTAMQLYVTKTGKVRVYGNNPDGEWKEWKPQ